MVDCLGDGGGGVRGEGGGRRGWKREEGGDGVVDYCCPFGLCEGRHFCVGWVLLVLLVSCGW